VISKEKIVSTLMPILQEAVQGKLVQKDPGDEPASMLLERIRGKKQALIKASKIKRDKHESVVVTRDKIPYEIIDGKESCIADEVPFELLEGWCCCRLKSIINAVSARRVHQSDWKNSGIPFYRAREIAKLAENGYVDDELFISEELFAEYAQSGVPKSGDLMVTDVGTLGKTYIVRDTDKFYYKDVSVICF
jgi:type I restriction enzyme S subunit